MRKKQKKTAHESGFKNLQGMKRFVSTIIADCVMFWVPDKCCHTCRGRFADGHTIAGISPLLVYTLIVLNAPSSVRKLDLGG